jgi:hypothetical protein
MGECNAPVTIMRTNLFLKLQDFVLQLVISGSKVVELLLFGLESFFCLFGVRTNIVDRRIRFDLHDIHSRSISGRASPAVNHDDSLEERTGSRS